MNLAPVVPIEDTDFKEIYAKFKAHQEHRDYRAKQSKLYFDANDEF